jgi:hypothetical protein
MPQWGSETVLLLPPVQVAQGGAVAVEAAVEVETLQNELHGGGDHLGALVFG